MPSLVCTFCDHKWNQRPLEIWRCPSCELGAAVELVTNCTNDEIETLWNFLTSFSLAAEVQHIAGVNHDSAGLGSGLSFFIKDSCCLAGTSPAQPNRLRSSLCFFVS